MHLLVGAEVEVVEVEIAVEAEIAGEAGIAVEAGAEIEAVVVVVVEAVVAVVAAAVAVEEVAAALRYIFPARPIASLGYTFWRNWIHIRWNMFCHRFRTLDQN